MAERPANSENAAQMHLEGRRNKTNRMLMRLGFGAAVVGAGLLLAAHLFAPPVIPLTAATYAGLQYSKAAGKFLVIMGLPLGLFGGAKQLVDNARA
jgi:hypothetical protein